MCLRYASTVLPTTFSFALRSSSAARVVAALLADSLHAEPGRHPQDAKRGEAVERLELGDRWAAHQVVGVRREALPVEALRRRGQEQDLRVRVPGERRLPCLRPHVVPFVDDDDVGLERDSERRAHENTIASLMGAHGVGCQPRHTTPTSRSRPASFKVRWNWRMSSRRWTRMRIFSPRSRICWAASRR